MFFFTHRYTFDLPIFVWPVRLQRALEREVFLKNQPLLMPIIKIIHNLVFEFLAFFLFTHRLSTKTLLFCRSRNCRSWPSKVFAKVLSKHADLVIITSYAKGQVEQTE